MINCKAGFGLLLFLLFSSINLCSQKVLYLEEMTEVKALKFYQGETVEMKLHSDPEVWHKVKLTQIMDDQDLILSDLGMIQLADISHIRRRRKAISAISAMLKGFGAGILVFGTLGQLGENPASMEGVIAVAASSFGAGWLTNKLWKYKVYKIGRQNRLKLIDLSLPEDPYPGE